MSVSELFWKLGELILLGKGDAEVGMLCDGFWYDIDSAYTDKHGDVILGDLEAQGNMYLNVIDPKQLGEITLKDKYGKYITIKLAFGSDCYV